MYLAIALLAGVIVVFSYLSLRRRRRFSSRRQPKGKDRSVSEFHHQALDDAEEPGDSVDLEVKPEVKLASTDVIEQCFAIHLLSKGEDFAGYELLQSLLSHNLRFGQHKIFHRFRQSPQSKEIVFSVASMFEPGTFDLQKMGNYQTKGLTLFVLCKPSQDALVNFDTMLETAYSLAEEMDAVLLDDNNKPLSLQRISEWRKSIRALVTVSTEVA